jgi:hypothetical protein
MLISSTDSLKLINPSCGNINPVPRGLSVTEDFSYVITLTELNQSMIFSINNEKFEYSVSFGSPFI